MTKNIFYLIFCLFLCSCYSHSGEEKQKTKSTYQNSSNEKDISIEDEEKEIKNSSSNSTIISDDDDKDKENKNSSSNNSGCKFSDGTYSATVNYNNPETGYSQTYTLEVDVEDCQVVKIYFPKGGWLDEDHITAADIDDDGSASVEGEEGRTYEIQIDD